MSSRVQTLMLEFVVPHLTEAEIVELQAELAKLAADLKPNPRKWQLFDMVSVIGTGGPIIYLRSNDLPPAPWTPLDAVHLYRDDVWINQQEYTYIGNLRMILEQGTVLVGLTEEVARALATSQSLPVIEWDRLRSRCDVALAERETK